MEGSGRQTGRACNGGAGYFPPRVPRFASRNKIAVSLPSSTAFRPRVARFRPGLRLPLSAPGKAARDAARTGGQTHDPHTG
ncbi:hypothetical protein CFR79_14990 [Komagataeibacter saccharivorans]|nr:hypothetical protein CFR79_14990 [Komagataeibacter saccharivorans]